MTWTNAFILGPCRVEVFQVDTPDTPDYSGILAMGASADLTLGSWAMHIAVSADGVVTLTNQGTALEVDVGARIIPGYGVTDMDGVQALLPSSASGAGDASADGSSLTGFINGDASVDLSAQTPYDRISVQTNTIGSSTVNPVVQFTPEFDVPPPPPTIPPCDELGRSTRVNVSGYSRTSVHDSRLVRGEKRCLVANFNGAIPASRTIASVIWRCAQPYVAIMSNARVIEGARQTAIDIAANFYGSTAIKCEAMLDNGEVMAQLMRVSVMDSPWFDADTVASDGPYTLTVTA